MNKRMMREALELALRALDADDEDLVPTDRPSRPRRRKASLRIVRPEGDSSPEATAAARRILRKNGFHHGD